jgi:hypothetical protein
MKRRTGVGYRSLPAATRFQKGGLQLQAELPHSISKFRPEPYSIRFPLNVSQLRPCTAALGRSVFRPGPFPMLQHAGVKPFLSQPHDAI